MKEVSPGLYTGNYRVKKGDKIDNALIITSLSNEEGLTAKKFYKKAQSKGYNEVFSSYRLRIAEVIRDYTMVDREEAPQLPPAVTSDPPKT